MNFNKHSDLKAEHALLSASKCSWLNKSNEKIIEAYARGYIKTIGTAIHDIARKHIQHGFKMTKGSKKEIMLSLIEDYKIPGQVIDIAIDFDFVYENLMNYVNDAIGYRMVPEQILYYSDNAFGTADAITSLDNTFKNRLLRIHDLKTGTTPAKIEQLLVYAAYFCLEYNTKPSEIQFELRIYQGCEVLIDEPEADDILPIMDRIIAIDKVIKQFKEV